MSVEEYYRELDKYTENNIEKFRKPFEKRNKKILDKVFKCEYWEDAFKTIVLEDNRNRIDHNDFALSLLNAVAIGHLQIKNKVNSLNSVSFAQHSEAMFDTFEEARKFFTGQLALSYEDYLKLEDELKQYAFSIKGITTSEQGLAISEMLLESFDQGESFYNFKKRAQDNTVLATKTVRELDLIYTQNMNNAYSYGRYKGLMEAVDIFPNWEYVTIGDGRVRPTHAAINGTIRRFDDPFWNAWYPPNGFKCRCVVEVTTGEPNGQGLPDWDKEHYDRAVERGSMPPMKDLIGANKSIKPDKGFFVNRARLDAWIGEKTGMLSLISQGSEIGNRKQLIDIYATNVWTKKKYPSFTALPNNLDKEQGIALVEELLKDKHYIEDKYNSPIFIDPKSFVEHFGKNFDKRKIVLPILEKFFKGPAETWVQLEKYGKSQKIVGVRKYFVNINNEPWVAIVEYPRMDINTGKDITGLPVLTTVYPLNIDNIELKRNGVLLKY